MNTAKQLALLNAAGTDATDPYYAAIWLRMRDLLCDVVAVVGVKKAAADLDTSPSTLKHALAGRDRHHVRAEWLPYLIANAPGDDLVELIASMRGLVVAERRELTPEERLDRLEQALAKNLSPAVRQAIEADAFGPRRGE